MNRETEQSKKKSDNLICRMPYKVNSSNTDMNRRLRAGALTDLLIQAAINSADQLHAGFNQIREQHLFWVLSRITVEIHKILHWYQCGEVETWPKNIEKIIYLRDFLVKDEKQDIAVRATSGWLALDTDTKRPQTIKGDLPHVFTTLKDIHALQILPEKLIPVKEGEISELISTYFDIDLNGHVTASRYLDWMMDTFTVEFHRNHYPRLFSINYLNETWIHERVQLTKTVINDDTFLFEGFNLNRNIIAFLGKIVFKPDKAINK